MTAPAIRVEGLWKDYALGAVQRGGLTFREAILENLKAPLRHLTGRERRAEEERFWALKDVSFEVAPGEAVGIIGRNGAGKSTLLKILSRITAPAKGRIEIRGRVASLLEVGTGFHPELTGRENIRLNGAILGMSSAEIRAKFDEIVAFSGVEKFIDTPVKRYSSGMQVRLAFAVAAHLDPEILIVDEVLAVGDAEFQKKCLGKMGEIASAGGRTVLFVSHNLQAIEALCPVSLLLRDGMLDRSGKSSELVAHYISQTTRHDEKSRRVTAAEIDAQLSIQGITLDRTNIRCGEKLSLLLSFNARAATTIRECAVLIYNDKNMRIAIADFRSSGRLPIKAEGGPLEFRLTINRLPLIEGDYNLGLYITTNHASKDIFNLAEFTILPAPFDGTLRYSPLSRGVVDLERDCQYQLLLP